MVEDRFHHWCSVWANEFAIRHPDDLSSEERLCLHEHAGTCLECAAALQHYLLCNALLRDHPFEEMFLTESAAMIHADGKVPAALEQLWEEQKCAKANRRVLQNKRGASTLNEEDQRAQPSPNAQTVKYPSPHQVTTSPIIIDILVHCSSQFSELLVRNVDQTANSVESIVGTALLELFETVLIENVTVSLSPEEAAQGLEVNDLDLAEGHQTL